MTQIFAHRGFSGKYPENTMIAFEKAIELGCDGIELDVHLTKDDELVIIHDEDISRTSNGQGLVKFMTYEQLLEYDYSFKFHDEVGFQKILTLREYFELVKDTNIITNIELKTGIFEYETIEQKVIDLIHEFKLEDKIILSSFNHFTVMRCKAIDPNIELGFLIGSWMIDLGAYTASHGVQCCHPLYLNLIPEVVQEIHAAGRKINTWTVNEYDDIKRLADLGVDCLIGNYPDKMIEVLR